MEITINADELTFGQAEFLEDFTGLDLDELLQRIQDGRVNTKMTIAIMAMSINPETPAQAVETARALKVADTQVS